VTTWTRRVEQGNETGLRHCAGAYTDEGLLNFRAAPVVNYLHGMKDSQ